MDFDQRTLPKTFVENAAQGSARCVTHALVIAAQPWRQLVDCALDGVAQHGSRCFSSSRLDDADQADGSGRPKSALVIEHQRRYRGAVEGDAAAILERLAVEPQQPLAIACQAAHRDLVDDTGAGR